MSVDILDRYTSEQRKIEERLAHLLFRRTQIDDTWHQDFDRLLVSTGMDGTTLASMIEKIYARDMPGTSRDGFARVACHYLRHQRYEDALRFFERDDQESRMTWWPMVRLVETYVRLDRMARALAVADELYRNVPDACNAYSAIADVLAEEERFELAQDYYNRDANTGRLTPGTALNRAVNLMRLGESNSATLAVREAYRLDPALVDGFSRLALALADTGGDMEQVLELFNHDFTAQRLSTSRMFRYAMELSENRQFSEAVEVMSTAYNRDMDLENGLSKIAWMLYTCDRPDAGQSEIALDLLARDFEAGRQTPEWTVVTVYALAAANRHDRARQYADALYHRDETAAGALTAIAEGICTNAFPVNADAVPHICIPELQQVLALLNEELAIGRHTEVTAHLRTDVTEILIDACCAADDVGPNTGDTVALDPVTWFEKLRELAAHGTRMQRRPWNRRECATRLFHGRVCTRIYVELKTQIQEVLACFPAITDDDMHAALNVMLTVEEEIVGRHCGDYGDRLSQYCAVIDYLRTRQVQHADCMDIGVLYGGSCLMKLFALQALGAEGKVTAIDPLAGYYGGDEPQTGIAVNPDTFTDNIRRFGFTPDGIDLRQVYSNDPTATVDLSPHGYGVIMIDGDHSYDGVLDDWNTYHRYIAPSGYVLFDDFDDESLPEVTTAVYEIVAELPDEWRVIGRAGTTMILQYLGDADAASNAA